MDCGQVKTVPVGFESAITCVDITIPKLSIEKPIRVFVMFPPMKQLL